MALMAGVGHNLPKEPAVMKGEVKEVKGDEEGLMGHDMP